MSSIISFLRVFFFLRRLICVYDCRVQGVFGDARFLCDLPDRVLGADAGLCQLLHHAHGLEDFEVFDDHAFYEQLRHGVLPNTSALSREQYLLYFEPVFAAGDDIFYVHFSRAMTASFGAMDQALEILRERYPDRRFYELDTKGITTAALNAEQSLYLKGYILQVV